MSVLTINEISLATRKSRQALSKNKNLELYEVGFKSNGGRPMKLYDPKILAELFGIKSKEEEEEILVIPTKRKSRCDAGKPRDGRNENLVHHLSRMAFTEYMSSAIEDVRSACRRAINSAYSKIEQGKFEWTKEEVELCERGEWLYFNWVIRISNRFRGPAHEEGWEVAHREHWHKWNAALKSGHNRHCFWKIAENDLGCERGRGRGRFVMLDDRKTDVWTRKPDGGFEMCYAIYAWDVLTGELLWVEKANGSGVSGNDYVRCILGVLYRCGSDCQVWAMENSRAATAIDVRGALDCIYTDEDKAWFNSTAVRQVFKNQAPIMRNMPHIPRDIGKGFGERMFGEIKRWDALLYPQSYHGGSISEAVQLTQAVMPTLGSYTPTRNEYFYNLLGEPYNDYLDRPSSTLKLWAKKHGSEPTRRAMIDYYTPSVIYHPTAEQSALLLYHATTDRHTVKYTNYGGMRCQINNRMYNLRHDELYTAAHLNKKLTIIPLPGREDECAIFETKPDLKLLCIAEDFTADSANKEARIRVESCVMREEGRQRVRNFTEQNLLADPVELANERRKAPPEKPTAPTETTLTYTEVISPERDKQLLKNIHNLY